MSDFLQKFNAFYQAFFLDRWPTLSASLNQKSLMMSRKNYWLESNQNSIFPEDFLWSQFANLKPASQFTPPARKGDLLDSYVMDPGSVCAALALNVQPGYKVLDACAAPGGKALILAELLKGQGHFAVNEFSSARRERLKKVLQQYIPKEIRQDHLWLEGKDANILMMKQKDSFDRILLDVPCSGETHLLENKQAQAKWSPGQSKKLALRQYALLANAVGALKTGGRLVYSTCSLSPLENDGVLHKMNERLGDQVQIKSKDFFTEIRSKLDIQIQPEETKHGVVFLPDRCGFGPLYLAVVEKQSGPGAS
ncbi:MAG: RsmB/NOP family class I SAM-dependent RNA methyltransferase [Pseudobdellovibrionaceae bacterium]